jgi:phage baseplate assembly protein W
MPNYAPKLPLDYNQTYGPYTSNTQINDVIKQNLKMLVLTNPGERIMIPNFGVGISKYIFENKTSSTYAGIESNIRSQVNIYMPFLNIQKVLISDLISNLANDYYENALQISIYYIVPTAGISDILLLTMNNQG